MTEKNEFRTETAEREFVITRIINAPPELVFKAWTDPMRMVQWRQLTETLRQFGQTQLTQIQFLSARLEGFLDAPLGYFKSILFFLLGHECVKFCSSIASLVAPSGGMVIM